MMKVAKNLVLAGAIGAAGFAFAGPATTFVRFTPVDTGTYADNTTTVGNQEWYAICWSPDSTFAGITADCKPVGEGDRILRTVRVNTFGEVHCGVDTPPSGGYFFVYLLDTRSTTGAVSADSPDSDETPMVNGTKLVASEIYSSLFTGNLSADGNTYEISAPPEISEAAKIAAINPNYSDTQVQITVENAHPSLQYNVRKSDEAANIADADLGSDAKASKTGTFTFEVDKDSTGGAQFFKLVRQPLN